MSLDQVNHSDDCTFGLSAGACNIQVRIFQGSAPSMPRDAIEARRSAVQLIPGDSHFVEIQFQRNIVRRRNDTVAGFGWHEKEILDSQKQDKYELRRQFSTMQIQLAAIFKQLLQYSQKQAIREWILYDRPIYFDFLEVLGHSVTALEPRPENDEERFLYKVDVPVLQVGSGLNFWLR